jgi:hypothetical protein
VGCDRMLPHADVLCVIRYKVHQDHGEEDTPWSREGEEQRDLKRDMKLDPTSIEAREGREGAGRPRTRPTGPTTVPPGPSLGRSGGTPDFPRLAPGLRPGWDRPGRSQARSDRPTDRTARTDLTRPAQVDPTSYLFDP